MKETSLFPKTGLMVVATLLVSVSHLVNMRFVSPVSAAESKTPIRSHDVDTPSFESLTAGSLELGAMNTNLCAALLILPLFTPVQLAQDVKSVQNLEEAYIKTLEENLLADPNNRAVRNQLAKTLAVVGRYDEAAGHFEKLLADSLSSRNRWAVLNNYGNLYFLRDRLNQAEAAYKLALQADSSGKETYLNLGTLATVRDDSATAIAMYRQVVEDSVEVAEVEKMLGLSDEESAVSKASNHDPKKKKTKQLKEKVKSNLRKAGGKKTTRPGGKKGLATEIDTGSYENLASMLYWAEVK
jgi:tetratricopeptide (TPR) repeat protein